MAFGPAPRRVAVAAGGALAAALAVGLWLVGPVLWVEFDEPGVPPLPDARSLPDGAQVQQAGVDCGSGGCWRDVTLRWPGHSGAELLAHLGISPTPGGTGETCEPVSLLDRRRICLGVIPAGRAALPEGTERIYLRWDRPLGL